VQLEDIERIMEKLPGVEQVVVTPAPGPSAHGPRIAAFCVVSENADWDDQKIRSRCFDLLPRYAMPDEVHVMSALPLLATGKVDRRALAAELSHTGS
jgi:acyl-CoA synthetase (AMP-forming)/AMP-acid ligase II